MKPILTYIQLVYVAILGCIICPQPILADEALPACLAQPNRDCLLDAARTAAGDIGDPVVRVAMLGVLASREALLGLTDEALDHFEAASAVSKTIEWPEARLATLSIIADRQVDAGLYDHARRTLADAREFLEAQISSVELGERDDWYHRKDELDEQQARIEARAKVAIRNRQANADAAKIEDPYTRFSQRILTASSQFDSDDRVDVAETLANAMLDAAALRAPEEQIAAWLEVGRLQLQLGQNRAARDSAQMALAAYGENGGLADRNVQTALLALFLLGLADQ